MTAMVVFESMFGVGHQLAITTVPELVAVRDGAGYAAADGFERMFRHHLGIERRHVAVPEDDTVFLGA